MSIINGKLVTQNLTVADIKMLKQEVQIQMYKSQLSPQSIADMLDEFSQSLNEIEFKELKQSIISMGFEEDYAKSLLLTTLYHFTNSYIRQSFKSEFLTNLPFEISIVDDQIEEKFVPMGVLTHITASNSPINPILSMLDGLITGNINIVKMPSMKNPFAEKLIWLLLNKNKELIPYIHILEFSSSNKEFLRDIVSIADCVVVWGSDKALKSIKHLVSHNQKLVTWGHKISFAYVSENSVKNEEHLKLICKDICISNQLACNAPQCILVETKSKDDLKEFSERLSVCMESISKKYPLAKPDIHEQSEITTQIMLAKAGEVFKENFVIQDKENNWCIIADYKSKLKPSPLFRTVFVIPVKREKISECIDQFREYLQTAIISCLNSELMEIQSSLIQLGVLRICSPGNSHSGYVGEPHDGKYTLREYVKRVRFLRMI